MEGDDPMEEEYEMMHKGQITISISCYFEDLRPIFHR